MGRALAAFVVLFNILCGAVWAEQAIPPLDEFRAADSQGKRSILRTVSKQTDAEENLPEIMMLVEAGLEDPDGSVRREAAAILNAILHGRFARQVVAIINESPTFERVLLGRLDDPILALRGVSVDALVTIEPTLSEQTRDTLVGMYAREGEPIVRRAILVGLSDKALDHDDVRDVVVRALEDQDDMVRRRAAISVSRFRPSAALPKIGEALKGSRTDPDPPLVVDAFVDALASYGAEAKPYLDVLKERLEREVRPEGRERLRRAIETIEKSRE